MKKLSALILSVAMLLTLTACGGGAESTVEEVIEARADGDFDTQSELMFDPYYVEYCVEKNNYDSTDDCVDEIVKNMEIEYERLLSHFGDDVSMDDFEIRKVTEYEDEEIEEIAEYLEDNFDYPQGSVDDVCVIKFKYTYEGEKNKDTFTNEVAMVEIDGDWYFARALTKDTIENIIR